MPNPKLQTISKETQSGTLKIGIGGLFGIWNFATGTELALAAHLDSDQKTKALAAPERRRLADDR
jgi:hypothetical protein